MGIYKKVYALKNSMYAIQVAWFRFITCINIMYQKSRCNNM